MCTGFNQYFPDGYVYVNYSVSGRRSFRCPFFYHNKKAGGTYASVGLYYTLLNIVWVWLEKKNDKVDYPAYSEKSCCAKIQDTHQYFAFIEFMRTESSEKKTKEKCDPFAFFVFVAAVSFIVVHVVVAVIYNDRCWLRSILLYFLYLTAAMCTDNRFFRNFLSAELTEFCRTCLYNLP